MALHCHFRQQLIITHHLAFQDGITDYETGVSAGAQAFAQPTKNSTQFGPKRFGIGRAVSFLALLAMATDLGLFGGRLIHT